MVPEIAQNLTTREIEGNQGEGERERQRERESDREIELKYKSRTNLLAKLVSRTLMMRSLADLTLHTMTSMRPP